MENLLKVGDKVYKSVYRRWDKKTVYFTAKVERLTKTLAVLDNGEKVINEVTKDYNQKDCFSTFGDIATKYYIADDAFEQKLKDITNRKIINNWFNSYAFSFAQKEQIFNLFNK